LVFGGAVWEFHKSIDAGGLFSPPWGTLRYALGWMAVGLGIAFAYEGFALDTKLEPTISGIIARIFAASTLLYMTFNVATFILIGALNFHFTFPAKGHPNWWVTVVSGTAFLIGNYITYRLGWFARPGV
jgi:hypothetical protein